MCKVFKTENLGSDLGLGSLKAREADISLYLSKYSESQKLVCHAELVLFDGVRLFGGLTRFSCGKNLRSTMSQLPRSGLRSYCSVVAVATDTSYSSKGPRGLFHSNRQTRHLRSWSVVAMRRWRMERWFVGVESPFLIAIMCLQLATAAGAQEQKPEHVWDYGTTRGPSHWGELKPEFASCMNGHHQSPIDIRNPQKSDLPAIEFDYKPSPWISSITATRS